MDATPLPVVGIDVSKATLAVCYQVEDKAQHLEVSNSKAGFQQLVKACGARCPFVMEATGTYNLALAYLPARAGWPGSGPESARY